MDIDDNVAKQAAYWFATLQDESHSTNDELEFQQWLASSQLHREAWNKVSSFSHSLAQLDQKATKHALTLSTLKRKEKLYRNALISCVLLIGVTAITYLSMTPTGTLQTQIGETKEFYLSDGTQLWLNTNTRVQIDYYKDIREIRLERGEIWLRTGHDNPASYKDLVVETTDGKLTALGTEFNVHYQPDFTELNVFEGAVEISPADIGTSKLVVPAGQQGRFDETEIIEQGLKAEHANVAWMNGILLANDQPLCEFIDELNRYRQQAIQCSTSLNHYNIVGTYPLQNMTNILSAIEASLPVVIQQNEQGQWQVSENL